MFNGAAEYETIAAIKDAVRIPVFANGDIDSPRKAKLVLEKTGADGLMIGRSAQGAPWIFREINFYLASGKFLQAPTNREVRDIMRAHLRNLYAHYGEWAGIRVARKHIAWYARGRPQAESFRHAVMQTETPATQLDAVQSYFDALSASEVIQTAA